MATKTASSSGNWGTAATWGGPPVPVAGDDIVINNDVVVTVAAGLDLSNYGTLTLNNAGSRLQIGAGVTVVSVKTGWTIYSNAGTVTTNNGTITTNAVTTGVVTTNASVVTTNNGTVTTNAAAGTVTTNASGGVVTTNTGTVTTNQSGGVVTSNAGTVTTNAGTCTCTLAGIVTNNTGALLGNLNITAGWSITGGDLSGASAVNIVGTPAALDSSGANLVLTALTIKVFAPVTLTKGAGTVTTTNTKFQIAGPAGTVSFSGLTGPAVSMDPRAVGEMVSAATT